MRPRVPFFAIVLFLPVLPSLRPQSPAEILAPSGTLRAAYLGTNPVHGRVDPQTGAATGPVPDLVGELARRLDVPYALIPAPDVSGVIEHVKSGAADIGFMAYETSRAEEVDFAGEFILMHSSFIVRTDSPLESAADADRAGIEIGAVDGNSQGIFLGENLKNARLELFETMPSQSELERLIVGRELDAFGLNRQRALDAAAASSRLRVLPDSFLSVEQAFVVEKGHVEKARAIDRFVDDVRASGFIRSSIERAGLGDGVDVAPPRR